MTDQNQIIKNEIIDFVRNSPEEVNSKVAVFIAEMQAQKSLMRCREGRELNKFYAANSVSGKKQGV